MGKFKEVNKLLVSWKGPETKTNYFVGTLQKTPYGYEFEYNKEIVKKAAKEGFRPFVGFNDLNRSYKNSKLFSMFERRLPNKNRNVFKMFVKENNLKNTEDHDWEYLRIKKGQLATDSISFLEPIVVYEKRMYFRGELAGWSFTKDNNKDLNIKNVFQLRIDTLDNPAENKPVELIDPANNNTRVGYIPKPYNDLFYNLLLNDYHITAEVSSIDENSGRPTVEIDTSVNIEDIKDCGCDYLIHYENRWDETISN